MWIAMDNLIRCIKEVAITAVSALLRMRFPKESIETHFERI